MRVAAVLMVVALLFPALAYANEVQEGSARAPNESVDLIGGVDLGFRNAIYVDSLGRMRVIPMAFNGSSWDSLRVDASGILRVVNEYPNNLQTVATTLGTGGVTPGMLRPIGNSFTAHPYGKSAIRVVRNGDTGTVLLFLMASDDQSNFYPVSASAFAAGAGTATTAADTLAIQLASLTAVIPLPNLYYGRYIQVWGYETVDTVADSTMTIVHWGRYD